MRQVVLDTETTGLEPSQGHRIIEIGCIELINRRLTGNRYHQYVKPDRDIDDAAVEIHGITNEFLADKPHFADVAEDFLGFIRGAELIIHNAPFDVGFINREFQLLDENFGQLIDYRQFFGSFMEIGVFKSKCRRPGHNHEELQVTFLEVIGFSRFRHEQAVGTAV